VAVDRRTITIIVLIGVAVLAGVAITINVTRARPEPAPAIVKTEAPKPVVKAPPKPQPSPPAPAPERRVARGGPAPKAEPEPVPAPVEAAPETGVLHIDTDIPGAQVFMDREYLGATPVTAQDIKPGTHHLNLSVKGYDGIAQDVEVTAGPRDILIKFKEVHLDARLDVVHKHRVGSCKGRLIATPRGVRYETTDKNDAFSAALLDLETFEINYLEKRLTLKPRKGKRYDFTDPEGNADRLFVFHRDVEKARERLQKGDPAAEE
jgi:hypothetical protein